MRALAVALMVGMTTPAMAAEWWLVGANSRSAMFVDRASVRREGTLVTQQVVAVSPNLPVRRIEVVERLDCAAGTATDLEVTYVLADGTKIARPPAAKPRRLTERTIGQATHGFACGSDEARAAIGTPVGEASLEEIARLALSLQACATASSQR
jgi:hypothetical protein